MCPITRPPDGWHVVHLDGPSFCTVRDRALIRAIVRHDYEQQKEHIFRSWIVQMREHGIAIATVWNYTSGRAKVVVEPDPNYTRDRDWAARAGRSGGRMQMNYVFHPGWKGFWALPTRTSDSAVYAALYTIAKRLPPGTVDLPPNVIGVVNELVERSRRVVEII